MKAHRSAVAVLGAAVLAVIAACGSSTDDGTSDAAGTGQTAAESDSPDDTAATGDTAGAGDTAAGGEQTAGSAPESGSGADSGGPAVDPDVQGGPIEIGVLTADGTPGKKFLEGVGKTLTEQYPGTEITFTFANTEARPAIEQRWRQGDGLDVDYGMFDGTNPNLLDWANEGALLDLTPYLEQDIGSGSWLDSFSPAAQKFMQNPADQKYYGVPTEVSAMVLFYNAKIFADNDIDPPATWDDLMTAVDELKAAGVDPIAVTGQFEPYMGLWSDYLFTREVGYETTHKVEIEGEGHITDDPGFLAALKKIEALQQKDAFLEGFQGTDFTAAQAQFFQGKAGMILMGSWLVSEMKAVIPPDFELGVTTFPTVADGNGDQEALMGKMQLISVDAQSDNPGLAVAWARLLTDKDVQSRRAKETGEVSAVVGASSPEGLPGISDIVGGAGTIYPAYYGILESKAKDAVYPEIAKLFFGVQNADQTLAAIDANLRQVYGN